MSSTPCSFPECDEPASLEGEDGLVLCAEHRQLLVDNPGEFRRLWGALDPRPQALKPYMPRHIGGTAPDDTA